MADNVKKCGCPKIVDEDWDLKEHEWDDKHFYGVGVPMFLHIPVGLNRWLNAAVNAVRDKGYSQVNPPMIMMKDGLFKGLAMIGIANPVAPDPRVTTIHAGTVISKVHGVGRRGLTKAVAELLSYIRSKTGTSPQAVYFWYVSCEECRPGVEEKTVIIAKL